MGVLGGHMGYAMLANRLWTDNTSLWHGNTSLWHGNGSFWHNTSMVWHSQQEVWLVSATMVACFLCVATLMCCLFVKDVCGHVQFVFHYCRVTALKMCCVPFLCCAACKRRCGKYITRRATAIEAQLQDADLTRTTFDWPNPPLQDYTTAHIMVEL